MLRSIIAVLLLPCSAVAGGAPGPQPCVPIDQFVEEIMDADPMMVLARAAGLAETNAEWCASNGHFVVPSDGSFIFANYTQSASSSTSASICRENGWSDQECMERALGHQPECRGCGLSGAPVPVLPAPLPASAWMLLAALGGIGAVARRKQRMAA